MPNVHSDDTIAALATPPGEGGLAVIRLSGAESFRITGKVFRPHKGNLDSFASHTLHLGKIENEKGEIVDETMIGLFRSPHSYTGEDVIEISSHGGVIVTKKILDLLISHGARHAEPGEFTKRAFLNGKIDLTQAEAVLDLIKAKSEKSLETAIRQLTGNLSRVLKALRDELMTLYAHMEAYLDFPDEHLEIFEDKEFLRRFAQVEDEIARLIASFQRGSLFREGISAVIVGKPNVGKSSLFNALLARDRALVSEFPGTTRDSIEEALEIGGIYIRLMDTAGLSYSAEHPIDRMGMERTRTALQAADLFLYIVDGSSPLEEEDRRVFEEMETGKPVIVVVNKCDLDLKIHWPELQALTGIENPVKISTKNRAGLNVFEKQIVETLLKEKFQAGEEHITRLRHRNVLEAALEALRRAKSAFQEQHSLEFVAVDVKTALDELRELIGEIYSEDLLDVIFSEFCIGK